jgi:hypothetical protein
MTAADQTFSIDDLEKMGDEIAQIAVAMDKASHRQLTLLRSFDEGGGWAVSGSRSCAAWLSWRTGLGRGPANERMRVTRALAALPLIDNAFSTGELSYSKVRALTRVADTASDAPLLEQARLMTGEQLEKLVAGLRRARIFAARGESLPVEPERFYRQRTTDEGMVRITVQLTADEAAAVTAALDAIADKRGRRAEALVAMADENLRGDRPDRSPTEVMIHVDAGSLAGEVAGTTADGELLSAETCRRLLCDAGVVPVLEDSDGKVLDVGRKTRTVPAAIRRAVALRDGGCQFPGCDNQIVDAHHVVHWADGGETSRDNLVSLCRGHHTFVHEGGASVRLVDGEIEFCDLRGDRIEAVPPRPPAKPLAVDHIDPWLGCAKNADPGPPDWPYIFDVVSWNLGWGVG